MRFKKFIPFLAGILVALAIWSITTFFIASPAKATTPDNWADVQKFGWHDMGSYERVAEGRFLNTDALSIYTGDDVWSQKDVFTLWFETASDTWAADFTYTYTNIDTASPYREVYQNTATGAAVLGGQWFLMGTNWRDVGI